VQTGPVHHRVDGRLPLARAPAQSRGQGRVPAPRPMADPRGPHPRISQSSGLCGVEAAAASLLRSAAGHRPLRAGGRGLTGLPESPVFGIRLEGCRYTVRPSAYAVLRDEHRRIAVVRAARGWFLPGGGIEPHETVERAVEREAEE